MSAGNELSVSSFLDAFWMLYLTLQPEKKEKPALGHQQMYDLERFYGTKVSFYKGTDSYKSYKLVQTPNFSVRLMP